MSAYPHKTKLLGIILMHYSFPTINLFQFSIFSIHGYGKISLSVRVTLQPMYGIFSILEYGKISLRVRATFQPMYLSMAFFPYTGMEKFHCMYGLFTKQSMGFFPYKSMENFPLRVWVNNFQYTCIWKISYYFFYSVV